MLFSEPKIPQSKLPRDCVTRWRVSVLFSEPKIPQSCDNSIQKGTTLSFSALQRAENSSIWAADVSDYAIVPFQCSSASRKFLNTSETDCPNSLRGCFSALQRAENSSIPTLAPASIHISDRDDHASSFLSLPGASP